VGFSNQRTLIIEWGDCDPAGIVFYPRFFAMFDTSTARLIEAATGKKKIDILRDLELLGWPMVTTNGTFHAPARFGDEATISSAVVRLGNSSFDVEHRLSVAGRLCVEGWETRVWAERDPTRDGAPRAARIPDAIRQRLLEDVQAE